MTSPRRPRWCRWSLCSSWSCCRTRPALPARGRGRRCQGAAAWCGSCCLHLVENRGSTGTDRSRERTPSTDVPHPRGPPLCYPIEHDGEGDDRDPRLDAEPELTL